MMRRPAMVCTDRPVGNPAIPVFWALMITSAHRPGWPGDVAIPDPAEAGLHQPSKVRTAKVETLEVLTAERVGRLPDAVLAEVRTQLAASLGWLLA